MKKYYIKTAKISLVLVYLVIIAGAVVRMTGSGMGCPDWPKCFGYYIPPTEESQLDWQPQKEYKTGQVIILDGALRVARENFTTTTTYQSERWEPYTKHSYATFNVFHTWTEYLNRLLGALAGLATLLLAFISISFWKTSKQITFLSWGVVFAMGFQGWLGATVVYSVLEPVKISLHMVMALVIVGMILILIFKTSDQQKAQRYHRQLPMLLLFALLFTIIQIILGTQVREFIDEQVKILGQNSVSDWLADPSTIFYVHRSFSIVVVLFNICIAAMIYRNKLGYHKMNWVLVLLIMEVFTGLAMYYLHFPFATQPLHLVLASLLFGVQFYVVLEALHCNPSRQLGEMSSGTITSP